MFSVYTEGYDDPDYTGEEHYRREELDTFYAQCFEMYERIGFLYFNLEFRGYCFNCEFKEIKNPSITDEEYQKIWECYQAFVEEKHLIREGAPISELLKQK